MRINYLCFIFPTLHWFIHLTRYKLASPSSTSFYRLDNSQQLLQSCGHIIHHNVRYFRSISTPDKTNQQDSGFDIRHLLCTAVIQETQWPTREEKTVSLSNKRNGTETSSSITCFTFIANKLFKISIIRYKRLGPRTHGWTISLPHQTVTFNRVL